MQFKTRDEFQVAFDALSRVQQNWVRGMAATERVTLHSVMEDYDIPDAEKLEAGLRMFARGLER